MPNRLRKMFSAVMVACLMVTSACLFAACGQTGSGYDATKSHLYVFAYDGGWGREWLDTLIKEYETEYADHSFENGKTGVQVHVYMEKSSPSTAMRTDSNMIYFAEDIDYIDLASQGLILNISDIVKAELPDGSGTIESKMSANQKDAYTALNGNYYAIPFVRGTAGVTYDADLFSSRGYYLKADTDGSWIGSSASDLGNSYFTSTASEMTVGADGIKNTYDDGLPSTIVEFKALVGRIAAKGDAPFIWSGQNNWYPSLLGEAVYASMAGIDQAMLAYNFGSGEGEDVMLDYVSGFDSNGPVVEQTTITNETGWKTTQSEALYHACDLLQYILSNSDYRALQWSAVNTHLETQRYYIYSNVDPQSEQAIAMLIEGSWWYNEAKPSFSSSVSKFGENAENRDFRWMPMPVKYDGGVAEGEGKVQTLYEANGGEKCVVNANIAGNKAAIDMVSKFLTMLYTDDMLEMFTTTTGGVVGVDYKLSDNQVASLNSFARSYYEVVSKAETVECGSSNRVFLNNSSDMIDARTWLFTSVVQGNSVNPFSAFSTHNYSLKDFFTGLSKKSSWSKYLA